MKPADLVVRDYVWPVLAEAGFRRRGNKFTRTAQNGDVACLEFRTRAGVNTMADGIMQARPDWSAFFVAIGVVPVPRWDWLCHQFPGLEKKTPDSAYGLWRSTVLPPPEIAELDTAGECWVLTGEEDVPARGELLARMLRDDVVPKLVRCLDRAEFLALCRDPARPIDPPPSDADLILLVDDGPSAELEAALAKLEALDPADHPVSAEYAAWLRARAAAV